MSRRLSLGPKPKKVDAPTETRIPIKEATARDLRLLNEAVEKARAPFDAANQQLQAAIKMIFNENDITEGQAVQVTDVAPFELVIRSS